MGIRSIAKRLDHELGRLGGRRQVLVDVRTPMNLTVLRPIWRPLSSDPRVAVRFTAEHLDAVARALEAEGLQQALLTRRRAAWTRFDLALTADLWSRTPLRRCRRAMTFFHGVAGKYDLDEPGRLAAADLDRYDRVAFINSDRMERYTAAAAVRRDQAALVGFPKLDGLLRGEWHPQAVRDSLGLSPDLETVLYAPTFSVASSLHLAGEAIIETVLDSGRSVIVKLHDRSLGIDPERTGGVDWTARLRRFERHPRYALARGADVSPLLAAADVLVTDHSTVGFEFALLDRPIVVYDAPDLKRVARISDGKWALLRSMADVVATPADLRSAMDRALADPGRLADARRAAGALFAHAGHATERALSEVYGLLELPPPAQLGLVANPAHSGPAASVGREPRLEVHG